MVAAIKELRWLIMGADGQLGRAFKEILTQSGITFLPLNRHQLDICDEEKIVSLFKSESPDVILNAAAWTKVDEAERHRKEVFRINAFGPKFLASASASIGAKFIHMSTDYVFSGDSTTPWNETTLASPISIYGESKARGEKLVLQEYPENSYVVRTAWLYSPWGRNFVKTMAQKALSGEKEVKVVANQIGQPTSALDLAVHILEMINKRVTPGIYHGTNSGQASWYEVAKMIYSYAGRNSNCVVPIDSSDLNNAARRPNYSVLGFDNWRREGMQPMRNWEDALESTLPFILKELVNERLSN